jgi:signal transduction histidine kinase
MVERLEADERQRRSLLADVSHELRTPLAVLQGNLEAIVDGVHPADEAHLGALVEETRVLARLIEDLRTVALSEAGTLALHREPVDVGVVAADVATSFRADASAAGIELVVDVPEELRLLDADPVRLREVLANLLANALRHTPAGGSIRLAARVPSGDQGLEIIVSDTGRGIPPDLLPHVFDRFAKSAESHGSGLGLAIAKALVEAHGGTISAMSPPGDGATGTAMTIRLPLDDRSVRGAA